MPQVFTSSDNSVTNGALAEIAPSALILTLLDSSVSVPDFMACAQALRGYGTPEGPAFTQTGIVVHRPDHPPANMPPVMKNADSSVPVS